MSEITPQTTPTNEQLTQLYRRMLLIRRVEERLGEDFHAGKLPGGVHLYIGQEAVAAGVCAHLTDKDWLASTHRGHGHFLAKGGEPRAMMAEVYGRREGICGGMGGSMHVADFSKGILGANGIVAGGMALTVGAALAAQLDGDGHVATCFFGDGAANQGVFMEALNIGTLWKLPLILICENNGFSEFSPSSTVTAGEIAARAAAFEIPSDVVDGNDVVDVWRAASRAVERARNGVGPSFIEAKTYRIYGHNEGEIHWISESYREDAEIEQWRARDPIDALADHLLKEQICSTDELEAVQTSIAETVEDAARFAEAGELPDPERVLDLMFAGQRP